MPWKKTAHTAMYGGANWEGYVKTVSDCSPEQARRIALRDPTITFFFYCRGPLTLENQTWSAPKVFQTGDAVFFRGEPWYGRAEQCDAYRKEGLCVVYIGEANREAVAAARCYVTGDGSPAIDVVCLFAANLNQQQADGTLLSDLVPLAPQISVPVGGTIACAPPRVVEVLQSDAIPALQDKGITVLLTFLNNYDAAGWSAFASEADAQTFVAQLQAIVTAANLDGIDIDDEYSDGLPITSSLAMVTAMMRTAMPDSILSKALWSDREYFGVPYRGVSLEQTLTYGWEMSYGGSPQDRLSPYVQVGMAPCALVLGFWPHQPSDNPARNVEWLRTNGYGGVMNYGLSGSDDLSLLALLVDAWCGPGNWNPTLDCP